VASQTHNKGEKPVHNERERESRIDRLYRLPALSAYPTSEPSPLIVAESAGNCICIPCAGWVIYSQRSTI